LAVSIVGGLVVLSHYGLSGLFGGNAWALFDMQPIRIPQKENMQLITIPQKENMQPITSL
jgi:hypothetical protein